MAQLMPLPLTVSCFTKIQIGFTFLVPAHLGSPGKGPLNCVRVCNSFANLWLLRTLEPMPADRRQRPLMQIRHCNLKANTNWHENNSSRQSHGLGYLSTEPNSIDDIHVNNHNN